MKRKDLRPGTKFKYLGEWWSNHPLTLYVAPVHPDGDYRNCVLSGATPDPGEASDWNCDVEVLWAPPLKRRDLQPGDVFRYVGGNAPYLMFYVGPMDDPPPGAFYSGGWSSDAKYDVELISGPSMPKEETVESKPSDGQYVVIMSGTREVMTLEAAKANAIERAKGDPEETFLVCRVVNRVTTQAVVEDV